MIETAFDYRRQWPEEESIAGRQLGRRRSLFGPGVEVSLAEDDGDEMRDIV